MGDYEQRFREVVAAFLVVGAIFGGFVGFAIGRLTDH